MESCFLSNGWYVWRMNIDLRGVNINYHVMLFNQKAPATHVCEI